MQNSGRWLQGIQYFRAIAIIEVIVFHVTDAGVTVPGPLWIVIALRAFTAFGVSQFIFISGVALYNKYSSGFSLSTFYKKRFNAILPPYVVWSTFYFALTYELPNIYSYFFHHATVYGSNQTIASLTGAYLLILAVGIDHLWFVVVIIQLYLLYPLLVKMYNRATKQTSPAYILSFLLLVQICYALLSLKVSGANPFIALTTGTSDSGMLLTNLVLVYSNFLFYAFYFVLGFFIAEHYGAMKLRVAKISLKRISLAVLVSTIYYTVVYYRGELSTPAPLYYVLSLLTGPFYCLLLILFYLKLSTSWAEPHGFWLRHLEKVGEYSFGIYLVHWFFITVFSPVLFALGLRANNLLFYPVLFSLTLVSSYLSVEAIYRLPLSNIIIGKPRKKEITS